MNLDSRIAGLSPAQRIALARRLRREMPETGGAVAMQASVRRAPGSSLTEEALKGWLAASFPAAVLPTLQWVDAFPRLPNGKLDRRALAAVERVPPVAPTTGLFNATEAIFAGIWETVLGRGGFGPDDDFFALGGDSLSAMRVVTLARKAGLQCRIPSFFARPTIAALAAAQGGEAAAPEAAAPTLEATPEGPRVRRYRPAAGAAATVVIVHGIEGYGLLAGRLASRLPETLDLIGIEAPDTPRVTIEEIAAQYLAALEPLLEARPLYLAGYCFGGAVVYEMARILAARGALPARLIIIDAGVPFLNRGTIRRVLAVEGISGLGRRIWQRLGRRWADRGVRSTAVPHDDPEYFAQIADDRWAISRTHIRAILDYRPGPYDGATTLIATPPENPLHTATLGWEQRLARRPRFFSIEARHADLIKVPAVDTVAAILRQEIALDPAPGA